MNLSAPKKSRRTNGKTPTKGRAGVSKRQGLSDAAPAYTHRVTKEDNVMPDGSMTSGTGSSNSSPRAYAPDPAQRLWEDLQRKEAALNALENGDDGSPEAEKVVDAYARAQERFVRCRTVTQVGILRKLELVAAVDNMESGLKDNPRLIVNRLVLGLINDLNTEIGTPTGPARGKATMTTRKPHKVAHSGAANEPLLPLWRALRAAWAAEAVINRGPDGSDAEEGEDGPALRAYLAAFDAFSEVEPTTTLGLFLTLMHSDAGDDFADEHPEAVEAMIALLQAGNVSLGPLSVADAKIKASLKPDVINRGAQ